MRIAYIGPNWGTSLHRANALMRIGHKVIAIDPQNYLPRSLWMDRWLHHAGGLGVHQLIDRPIIAAVKKIKPDLIWIAQGAFLGKRLLSKLRKICTGPIVNYTNDDPFGGSEGRRFRNYLNALSYYDLVVVMRLENVSEAKQNGARRVLRVFMSADELAHRPRVLSSQDHQHFDSEVTFVGTWKPERGPFFSELLKRGVPLSIWGNRWHKAPQWKVLKQYWRGSGLYDDDSYAKAIQGAKVNIGLLSKGNRDLHTTRSSEIPALGGVLCAERTVEHQAMYRENIEAVFWSSAKECAEKCMALLDAPQKRAAIARNGRMRIKQNGNYNEIVVAKIIETALNG